MRGIPPALILAAMLLSVSAACTRESLQTGSLEITSAPAGLEVQVILDGDFRGVTPVVLTNLSAGYHLVQLRAPGYQEKVEPVTVNAGQRMYITVDYPPLPTPTPTAPILPPESETPAVPTVKPMNLTETPSPPGALYVTSFPSGATIYLDGKGYGITPMLIKNLTQGSHELRLSLVGWKDYRMVVSVSPGMTHREDAVLRS